MRDVLRRAQPGSETSGQRQNRLNTALLAEFTEQHGHELTSNELEVLSERIDNLDRHIIAFNDAAIDMLHRSISDRAFEEGSVVAANLLELLAGMQRYVYRAREALAECATDETSSELIFVSDLCTP